MLCGGGAEVAVLSSELTDQPVAREDRIAAAALRRFVSEGFDAVTFCDIADEAELPKSTAYRCLAGKRAVVQHLHLDTLKWIRTAVARRVRNPALTKYRQVVQAGAWGLFEGLAFAPWTGRYLVSDPRMANAYLLDPSANGVLHASAVYAERCAEHAGASGRVDNAAHLLVDLLLSDACRHARAFRAWPADQPEWPAWIDEHVDQFIRDIGLDLASRWERGSSESVRDR